MQRAPGEERMFRVPYGDGELEFMLQPWFDLDIAGSTTPVAGPHDIVIAGIGRPDDSDLDRASHAATRVWSASLVRDGGAVVLVAQLDEGAGSTAAGEHSAGLARVLAHCQVVVAASEAPEIVRLAGMRAAVDVEEALDIAYEHIGRPTRASVLLVPHATR